MFLSFYLPILHLYLQLNTVVIRDENVVNNVEIYKTCIEIYQAIERLLIGRDIANGPAELEYIRTAQSRSALINVNKICIYVC